MKERMEVGIRLYFHLFGHKGFRETYTDTIYSLKQMMSILLSISLKNTMPLKDSEA